MLTQEIEDVLFLVVHSLNLIDDLVLDSKASIHTTSHHKIMQNYIDNDFGKVHMGDGEALNLVEVGDVCIITQTGTATLCRKSDILSS